MFNFIQVKGNLTRVLFPFDLSKRVGKDWQIMVCNHKTRHSHSVPAQG